MYLYGYKNLKPKKEGLLSDTITAICMMCLYFLASLPLLYMTFIVSAFNDTGHKVESVLIDRQLMIFLVVPTIVVQVIFNLTKVKNLVKYKINKCLVALFSISIVILVYGMLSISYAPNCLFLKLLDNIF